jgi:hypothetical protein
MYNCKIHSTTATSFAHQQKWYVGIIHSFSTSAKQKHNCKIHGTTAKQIVQLQKKMHNGNFPLPSSSFPQNVHMFLCFYFLEDVPVDMA